MQPEAISIAEPQEKQDTEIDEIAKYLAEYFRDTFALLIERRDAAYKAALKPLDKEQTQLAEESASIAEAARNLTELLPAKARAAQAEHDRLLLSGEREGAAAKLAEQKEAEAAPAAMDARQRELEARWHQIEGEKESAAAQAFNNFYREARQIIRVVEYALFVVLLDGVESALFEGTVGGARVAIPISPTIFNNLTADERSQAWDSATKWYGGRGRR